MKKRFISLISLFFIIILVCCLNDNTIPEKNREVIYQFSTIESLLEGVYDGNLTFGELKNHGDYGLGTIDSLDGEMIQVEGNFYQIKVDGIAYPVFDHQKTPFAVVSFFDLDKSFVAEGELDYKELTELIDSNIPTKNIYYIIKVHGNFEYVKTRSVPSQSKPYPPLSKAVENQKIFELNHVNGTLIGFRIPENIGEINVPGYHFHFITDDKKTGGHVLDLLIKNQIVEIDYTSDLFLDSPDNLDFLMYDSGKDRSEELDTVEKGK